MNIGKKLIEGTKHIMQQLCLEEFLGSKKVYNLYNQHQETFL